MKEIYFSWVWESIDLVSNRRHLQQKKLYGPLNSLQFNLYFAYILFLKSSYFIVIYRIRVNSANKSSPLVELDYKHDLVENL